MTAAIEGFQGQWRFLSNFWPTEVVLDGDVYLSVEHAYVAAKTLDPVFREKIKQTAKPGDVKRLGRKLVLRPDWESVKLEVMTNLVRQKFSHPELGEKLRTTGTAELIETNHWGDTFWGVCRGVGENHLGKILMTVREEL